MSVPSKAKKKVAKKKKSAVESVTAILHRLEAHPADGVLVTAKQIRSMHVISQRHEISIASRKAPKGKGYLVWRLK